MKDLITYIADLTAFRAEISEIVKDASHPANELLLFHDGVFTFNEGLHTPVYYNGNKSLCLCRTDKKDIIDNHVVNMDVIGECINGEFSFYGGGKEIYESVYDTSTREININEELVGYTPPYKFGVMA